MPEIIPRDTHCTDIPRGGTLATPVVSESTPYNQHNYLQCISDSCMGQGPSVPHTKFQKIIIWLVWIMIIAGAFISANSEQTP